MGVVQQGKHEGVTPAGPRTGQPDQRLRAPPDSHGLIPLITRVTPLGEPGKEFFRGLRHHQGIQEFTSQETLIAHLLQHIHQG